MGMLTDHKIHSTCRNAKRTVFARFQALESLCIRSLLAVASEAGTALPPDQNLQNEAEGGV